MSLLLSIGAIGYLLFETPIEVEHWYDVLAIAFWYVAFASFLFTLLLHFAGLAWSGAFLLEIIRYFQIIVSTSEQQKKDVEPDYQTYTAYNILTHIREMEETTASYYRGGLIFLMLGGFSLFFVLLRISAYNVLLAIVSMLGVGAGVFFCLIRGSKKRRALKVKISPA